MPVPRLILGPLPALEDALASAISSARAGDPLAPATVLVGQWLLKRYLPRMLAARGTPLINVCFVLADELAEDLASGAISHAARMSHAAERLITRLAAMVEGPYFAETARSDGFVTALVRLSGELERGGFSPEALPAMLTAAGVAEPKSRHLAAIYAEQRRLRQAAPLAGPAEFHAAASPARLEGPLFVYGLWNPAAVTLALLDGLAATHDTTVFLPSYAAEQDEHAAFRAWLDERGAIIERQPGDDATLAHHVFALAGGAHSDSADVALISAPDTVREVWEAARRCIAWAKDGIPFHEMAVVYRHKDQHRSLIDEIFREAKIPAYLHDGSPLSEHPVGRRVLALLELMNDASFSRRRVMEFITETQFPRSARDAYPGLRPSEWDTYSREAGVVEGIEQWRTRLQRLANSRRERAKAEGYEWLAEHAGRIETVLRFVEELHAALASRPDVAPWETHLAFVRELADRYADGLAPVLEALNELKALGGIQPLASFEVFAQAVREELSTRDTSYVLGEPLREFGRTGVAVMDASSLRHMRFRAVYLLGLSERAWPAPVRPDPLLLEHERAALNLAAAGAALIPLRSTPDEEPQTFRLAIDAATERLVVSYARAQASRSGRQVPSFYLRSLAEAVAGRALTASELELGGVIRRLPAGRLSVERIETSVTPAEYDRGLIQHGVASGLGSVITALSLEGPVRSRRARWGRELSAFDGVLASQPSTALTAAIEFGRKSPVSASRLELYGRCPYKYFLRYVLRIEPLDEPEALDGIDHLERGSLIHAILERFLRGLGADDPPAPDARERHLAQLRQVAEAEARGREERGVTGRPVVWAIERKRIFDDLVRWYDAEVRDGAYTSLRPRGFEVGFGGPQYRFGDESDAEDPLSSEAPVPFDAGGLEILLQGRIDRIDLDDARTRFRVIDYKTGKTRVKAPPDMGRALQLPLYLHAAAQLLDLPVEQGEAQYFYCTSRGEFWRSTFRGDDLVERRDEMDRVLRTIAEGVDRGYFAPNPGKGADNCRFCEYKFVCNAGIDRIMEGKQTDGPAAAYIALQDIT